VRLDVHSPRLPDRLCEIPIIRKAIPSAVRLRIALWAPQQPKDVPLTDLCRVSQISIFGAGCDALRISFDRWLYYLRQIPKIRPQEHLQTG